MKIGLNQEIKQEQKIYQIQRQIIISKLEAASPEGLEDLINEELDKGDIERDENFDDTLSSQEYNHEESDSESESDSDIDPYETLDDNNVDIDNYNPYENYSDDERRPREIRNEEQTCRDDLINQLKYLQLDDKQEKICRVIISILDDKGFLSAPSQGETDDDTNAIIGLRIANELLATEHIMASPDEIEEAIKIVQSLDPAGIAARNTRESLLLQLQRLAEEDPDEDYTIPIKIIKHFSKELENNHPEVIRAKLKIDDDELQDALVVMREKLHPYPCSGLNTSAAVASYIHYDYRLFFNDAGDIDFEVMMPEYHLRVSSAAKKNASRATAADLFIKLLNIHRQNLINIIREIIKTQKDFITSTNPNDLQPLLQSELAERLSLDPSTISRIVTTKYVEMPNGRILPLSDFFSRKMTTDDGESVSTQALQNAIRRLVEDEDKRHPLSDNDLVTKLSRQGFNIARRTVAKHRDRLGIPEARLRKKR